MVSYSYFQIQDNASFQKLFGVVILSSKLHKRIFKPWFKLGESGNFIQISIPNGKELIVFKKNLSYDLNPNNLARH